MIEIVSSSNNEWKLKAEGRLIGNNTEEDILKSDKG